MRGVTEEDFDSKVGFTRLHGEQKETAGQLWQGDQSCEHLRLAVQGAANQTKTVAAKPRGGWDETTEVARRVALMPGGCVMREKLSAICILPRVR